MRRGNLYKHLCIYLMCLLGACTLGQNSAEQYISYYEDSNNKLKKDVMLDAVSYHFQFKSPEYIVCKEGQHGKERKEKIKALQNTVWFNIGVSVNEEQLNSDSVKYTREELLSYFLTRAEGNFSLKMNGEPLEMIAYHFQNNHKLVQQDVMVVGFKTTGKKLGNLLLTYNDVLFENGPINFSIDNKTLTNIPILKG